MRLHLFSELGSGFEVLLDSEFPTGLTEILHKRYSSVNSSLDHAISSSTLVLMCLSPESGGKYRISRMIYRDRGKAAVETYCPDFLHAVDSAITSVR